MKKRLFSLLTSLILVVSMVGVLPAVTASAETYGDYYYVDLNDGTVEITGYEGYASTLSIPSTINGKKVTSIGKGVFEYCSSLTSVTIPSSVTSIGASAFWLCDSLTSITIPDSVTTVGEDAFSLTPWLENKQNQNPLVTVNGILIDGYTCSDNVTIPNSITSIGDGAFSACKNLTSITIPDSVKSIGNNAFYYCTSLTSVTIGNSVTSIGDNAFKSCESLISVTLGNSVTSIGDYAFASTNITSVTIPNSVTSIGDAAFRYCRNLTSIKIGNGVTSIGDDAFYVCTRLTSVTISDSVTSIGQYAFSGCTNLKSVTLGNGVTSIGRGVFWLCTRLTSINVDSNNKNYSSADGVLFDKNKTKLIQYPAGNTRTSYTIPNSVKIIGYTAVLPNSMGGVQYCDEGAFEYCKNLTNVIIPNGVESIGHYSFYECTSLSSVTIPDSVTSIGSGAFESCSSLTSITIPDSVTKVRYTVFAYCTNLTTVTIPNSVTSIGNGAFNYCENLNDVYYLGTQAQWNTISIDEDNDDLINANIHFINQEIIDESSELVEESSEIEDESSEVDEDSSEIVADPSKDYDYNLLDDDTVEVIGYYGSSTEVVVPSKIDGKPVTSIGVGGFSERYNITSITIPDSVTTIGNYAFESCENLTSIIIPNSVTSIGKAVFSCCYSLTSITIPNSVTSIGDYAFYNCDSLTSITIPDSVTNIGDRALSDCTSLTSIAIPDSVTSIGEYAFYECTSISDVYYSGTQAQWNTISIDENNDDLIKANIHFINQEIIDESSEAIEDSSETIEESSEIVEESSEVVEESSCVEESSSEEIEESSSEIGSKEPVVIWEGSEDITAWTQDVSLGVSNIPQAEASGKIVIEATSIGDYPQLQISGNDVEWEWFDVKDSATGEAFVLNGNSITIVLDTYTADLVANAKYLFVKGCDVNVTKVVYIAPSDTISDSSSEVIEESSEAIEESSETVEESSEIVEESSEVVEESIDEEESSSEEIEESSSEGGSKEPEVLWEGEIQINKWKCPDEPEIDIPEDVAVGDIFEFEGTPIAENKDAQIQIGAIIGEEDWESLEDPGENNAFTFVNGKVTARLTEDEVALLKQAHCMRFSGTNINLTKFTYYRKGVLGSEVIWEGSEDITAWTQDVSLGVSNIPQAEPGGKIVIEATAIGEVPQLQISGNDVEWEWFDVKDSATGEAYDLIGDSVEIVLDAESAETLAFAKKIFARGCDVKITRVIYVTPGGVIPESSSDESSEESTEATAELLKTNTVSFKDNLTLNFLGSIDDELTDGAYVKFTYIHYGEQKEVICPIDLNDKNGAEYRFRCELTASEMAIDVRADLYLKDSTEPVSTWTRNIRDYCIAGLNSPKAPALEKALFRATLNYGGYTQKNFGYNGEPYANDDYEDSVENVVVESGVDFDRPEGEIQGIEYTGSTVFFRNAPYVRYYFKLKSGENIKNFEFRIGETPITPTYKNGEYYIESEPVLAYKLDDAQHVTVNKNEESIMSFDYSIIKWAEIVVEKTTKPDERNMAKAMYAYYQAAKAFVDNNNQINN